MTDQPGAERGADLRSRSHSRCRGAILPWVVVTLMVLIGFTALAVDVGNILSVHTELKTSMNAAALAGASGLSVSLDEARTRAMGYAALNTADRQPVTVADSDVELGLWDASTRTFTRLDRLPAGSRPDAVRVSGELTSSKGNAVKHFFAGALGIDSSDVRASSIAVFQPRDIMVVLDLSGSMDDDSELKHNHLLDQAEIEANLFQIWNEFGAPTFGSMQFDPVHIEANNVADVMAALGLDLVAYPYPSGGWEEYIAYVQQDGAIANAGYKKHYGYLTLVNYWLARQPGSFETPGLWATSEQPLTAVKDALGLFLDYMRQNETDDRVGLAVYTSTDGTALLESPLTRDLPLIEDIAQHRQSRHYGRLTNIGAGIQVAREELVANGRQAAFKMILLMTDGRASAPRNAGIGKQFAIDQAELAADAGLEVLAISLGARADTALMQSIADMSGGVHFNIPRGDTVQDMADTLNETFLEAAAHKLLRLVK